MAATVADKLLIQLGVDVAQLKEGLTQAQAKIASFEKTAQSTAPTLERASAGIDALGSKWASVAGMMARTILAPVAGFISLGSVMKSYFGDVAQVAQMTGAYTGRLDEWRKKRAMLQRVTKEDIELYKKNQQAVTKFQIAMGDLSAKIMRQAHPAIRKFTEVLDKVSDWVTANQDNIIRFLKVVAGVITTLMIPAIARMTKALLTNPLTWVIAALIALTIVIDDFIVWLNGGESALDEFWSMLGSREEVRATLQKWFTKIKEIGADLLPVLAEVGKALLVFGTAVGGLKLFKNGIMAITLAIKALSRGIYAIPIVGWIALAITLIWELWANWDEVCAWWHQYADKISAHWDTLCAACKKLWADVCAWFKDKWSAVVSWFVGAWESVKAAWHSFADPITEWVSNLIEKFKAIGRAIADAFSFDGIKEKFKSLLPNWAISLLGGGSEEAPAAAPAAPAGGASEQGGGTGGLAASIGTSVYAAIKDSGGISGLFDTARQNLTAYWDQIRGSIKGKAAQNVTKTTNIQNSQSITVNAASPEAADQAVTAATRELGNLGTVDAAAEGVN